MNPKITRVAGEIEKTKTKIAEAQARLRELEKQKTELGNAELVAAVRGMKATPEELEAFLAARRGAALPEHPGAIPAKETEANQIEA